MKKSKVFMLLSVMLVVSVSACSSETTAEQDKGESAGQITGQTESEIYTQTEAGSHLEAADKYLEAMDFEQALQEYQAAAEADPEAAESYLGILETYIRTNDIDAALQSAKEAYEKTGDERLKEKIDMLESGDITASNGWEMRRSGYDGDGNLIYFHQYTYGVDGKKATITKYNAQGVAEQTLSYTYDEQGRRLDDHSYDSKTGDLSKRKNEYTGNHCHTTKYVGMTDEIDEYKDIDYNDAGKELVVVYSDKNGKQTSKYTYEYNEAGKKTKRSDYDGKNQLTGYKTYSYNEEGQIVKEERYKGDGTLKSYTEHSYISTEEGKIVREQDFNANGVPEDYEEYVYDLTGKAIAKRYYNADGTLKRETRYGKTDQNAGENAAQASAQESSEPVSVAEKSKTPSWAEKWYTEGYIDSVKKQDDGNFVVTWKSIHKGQNFYIPEEDFDAETIEKDYLPGYHQVQGNDSDGLYFVPEYSDSVKSSEDAYWISESNKKNGYIQVYYAFFPASPDYSPAGDPSGSEILNNVDIVVDKDAVIHYLGDRGIIKTGSFEAYYNGEIAVDYMKYGFRVMFDDNGGDPIKEMDFLAIFG